MAEISEFEQRINAALDAISKGIEAKAAAAAAAPAPAPVDNTELLEELEDEKATNARLISGREKLSARIEKLETRVFRITQRLETAEAENKRLEDVIATLQSNNVALRAGNPGAVDASVTAELEQLRAARSADRAELDEILAELAPIVKEA